MPSHQDRRDPLPEGYQFGDMRPAELDLEGATFLVDGVEYVLGKPVSFDDSKPRPLLAWNVIEGERFDTNRDHGDETT